MINHFKAEFYKLRHSKILITILGVCAAVIMVSFALGDMTFFGAGDGTESVIGFQAKCYLSSEIPTFQTVARSSLAYTAFFWIIGILFATIFFTKEYNTGTIKLSVAYGTTGTVKGSMSVMNVMMTTLMKSRMISMKNIILHPKRKRSLSARMIMILEHLMMITIPVNMLISAFWKKKRSLLSSISSKESGTSDTL